jgi:hypothetical protein
MAKLSYSQKALNDLRSLPKDGLLLQEVFKWLEHAADDPATNTIPAPVPWPPIRRALFFQECDSGGRVWGFTAIFAWSDDNLELRVLQFNHADSYPVDAQ